MALKSNNYQVQASSNFLKFEFLSDGLKSKIKKQVVFKKFTNQPLVYNLGFGDVNEDGEINDVVVSNNGDGHKVLQTIAFIVYCFFKKYPDNYVFATGSTKSRTRLYRMGISNHLHEVTEFFEVYGLLNNRWETFEKTKEYEAFLVKRKNRKFVSR